MMGYPADLLGDLPCVQVRYFFRRKKSRHRWPMARLLRSRNCVGASCLLPVGPLAAADFLQILSAVDN